MLQQLYNNSPKFIQELMLTSKSRMYQKNRRGGIYRKYINDFMRLQWASRAELAGYQRTAFRTLFSEAYEHVPYYHDLFDRFGFHPNEFNGISDLKELPVLEKEHLRENPAFFENCERKTIYTSRTGGTTGAPLMSPYDSESMQLMMAIQDHYFQTVGIRFGLPCLYLCGQPIVPHSEKRDFCRIDRTTNSIFASVHHISKANVGRYIEVIRTFNPVWGMGYTSFAFELARYIIERNECGVIRLAGFMGTSETATPEMRHVIEKGLCTRFFDFYSSTEGIPFVGQCSAGRYHLHPASGIIEFLDENGNAAVPGQPAQMVMTSFKQRKRPLLRYAVKDTGILAVDQDCSCGLKWPVVEQILGRQAEWVVNNKGTRISQFSHQIFKVIDHVKASQIEQFSVDSFTIRLVVDDEWKIRVQNAIQKRFPEVLGHEAMLKIEFVESFERTSGGKCPTVISHL